MYLKNFFVLAIASIGLLLFGACQSNPFGARDSSDHDSGIDLSEVHIRVYRYSDFKYLTSIRENGSKTIVEINAARHVHALGMTYSIYENGRAGWEAEGFPHLVLYLDTTTWEYYKFSDEIGGLWMNSPGYSYYETPAILRYVKIGLYGNSYHKVKGVCLEIRIGTEVNNGKMTCMVFVPLDVIEVYGEKEYLIKDNIYKSVSGKPTDFRTIFWFPESMRDSLTSSEINEFGEVRFFDPEKEADKISYQYGSQN